MGDIEPAEQLGTILAGLEDQGLLSQAAKTHSRGGVGGMFDEDTSNKQTVCTFVQNKNRSAKVMLRIVMCSRQFIP